MTRKIPPANLAFYVLTALIFISASFLAVKHYTPVRVAKGVYICNVDFSGMDRKEGSKLLASIERDLGKRPITVTCGPATWELIPRELGIKIDKGKVLEKAFAAGRGSGIWARPNPTKVQLVFNVDREGLKSWAENKAAGFSRQAVEARLLVGEEDKVEIRPSRDGLRVDTDRLWEDLNRVLTNEDPPGPVALRFKKVRPELTTEEVQAMGVTGLLSKFETEFDSTVVNRAFNIKVAAEALDGLIVRPGQEVSFNDIVGPRSSEAGYKNAQVILNNAMVDGVGGGVCQVTSTLYNAVLLAGLKITERASHSLPVWYVPLGRDATVVYRQIDLKFCNDSTHHLYLKSVLGEGRLAFKIYGNTDQKKSVAVKSQVIEETGPEIVYVEDPTLPSGEEEVRQEGGKGYKVKTERFFTDEKGVLVKKELLSISVYRPVNRIIAVGIEGEDDGKVESN